MEKVQKLIGRLPKLDWKIAVMTVVSTTLILTDYYFNYLPNKPVERVITFLVIPLIIILVVFRENPMQYGFQLGDWRAGLVITGIAFLLTTPIIWLVVRFDPAFRSYYVADVQPFWYLWIFLNLIGWEFMFRGWLLFGYERKFGDEAIWLQAVPFAIAHLTKPSLETLSTIFGGFLFGWVAWRTRSFIYPLLIHMYIMFLTVILIGYMYQ